MGIHATRYSLKYKNKESESVYRRLSASYEPWGPSRRRRTKVGLFHHTLHSDTQIASKVTEEDGLETSANQSQEIRLLCSVGARNECDCGQHVPRPGCRKSYS